MEKYDYIICGGGASGLLLSNAFIKDKFFNDKKILIELRDLLNEVDNWSQEAIDSVLKEYQLQNELSVPAVNQPIRISLTGSTKSPGLGLTLSIFTKNRAIERINKLIDKLS